MSRGISTRLISKTRDFDAKVPPPKTAAFWAIVDAGVAPEDAEFADAIDALAAERKGGGIKLPDAVTLDDIVAALATRTSGNGSANAETDVLSRTGWKPVATLQCAVVMQRTVNGLWEASGVSYMPRAACHYRNSKRLRERVQKRLWRTMKRVNRDTLHLSIAGSGSGTRMIDAR